MALPGSQASVVGPPAAWWDPQAGVAGDGGARPPSFIQRRLTVRRGLPSTTTPTCTTTTPAGVTPRRHLTESALCLFRRPPSRARRLGLSVAARAPTTSWCGVPALRLRPSLVSEARRAAEALELGAARPPPYDTRRRAWAGDLAPRKQLGALLVCLFVCLGPTLCSRLRCWAKHSRRHATHSSRAVVPRTRRASPKSGTPDPSSRTPPGS